MRPSTRLAAGAAAVVLGLAAVLVIATRGRPGLADRMAGPIPELAVRTPSPQEPSPGGTLHKSKGCVSCHSVDGKRSIGPTLAGVFGTQRLLADGRTVLFDEDYFRRALFDPAAELTAGFPNQMMHYKGKLTEEEVDALIAYYRSLSGEGGEPGK
jgi:cytochrome c oxidase subunit II